MNNVKSSDRVDIVGRLLQLPYPEMVKALGLFEELDNYILSRLETEGRAEELELFQRKAEDRTKIREKLKLLRQMGEPKCTHHVQQA